MILRADRRAFTLVEVVLGVSLAVGIVGTALAFYGHAVDVREIVTERIGAAASGRLVMDRITDELRGATTASLIQIGVEGSGDEIRFVTTVLPGPAAWAERRDIDDPIVPEHDLQLVGYRLRIEENEDDEMIVVGLERTCQKLLAARTAEEDQEIVADLLTDRIKFIYLRYWDGSAWLSSWSGGDIPSAVEITLGRQELDEGDDPEEYAHAVSRRVVFVPGRFVRGGGAIIRGPGRGGR